MKIAYICSDVDIKVLGHQGCSVHIREFTNALVDAGHDVFIICAWLGEPRQIETKARIYNLQPSGHNKYLWESLADDNVILGDNLERDMRSILWNTWLQIEGARLFLLEKPDCIYERYALFGFGGLELRRSFGIPLILELNAPLCNQQEGYEKFPLIQTARKLEPEIIRSANAIIALTEWLADWAKDLGADSRKIHVLPDAVSGRLFGGGHDRDVVRQRLGLLKHQVVGFVGSFHRWHDVAGLIDAFAQLAVTNPTLRLLLVGDGHERKSLDKRVRTLGLTDSVIFVGNVPHEEVPQYIAAMDIAVVPYKPIDDFFFSPMKLFESMAVGRPTIAADLGQIPTIIKHGQTGWLYRAGDNGHLAESIAILLDDPLLAARIGEAARVHILANHTWEIVTRKVIEIAEVQRSIPGNGL